MVRPDPLRAGSDQSMSGTPRRSSHVMWSGFSQCWGSTGARTCCLVGHGQCVGAAVAGAAATTTATQTAVVNESKRLVDEDMTFLPGAGKNSLSTDHMQGRLSGSEPKVGPCADRICT